MVYSGFDLILLVLLLEYFTSVDKIKSVDNIFVVYGKEYEKYLISIRTRKLYSY